MLHTMALQMSNGRLASVPGNTPTFLTLPREIRDVIYDFCGFFEAKQIKCGHSNHFNEFETRILYVCRQIYQELQPRLYGSKWFELDMTPRDLVEKFGVRNAGCIRRLSINWTVLDLYARVDAVEELQLQAEESLRGIHGLAVQFWAADTAAFERKDFPSALKLIHEIAADSRYTNLLGKNVFAGYKYMSRTVLSRAWPTNDMDKCVALRIGQSFFEDDDQVSLQALQKVSPGLTIHSSLSWINKHHGLNFRGD